MENFWTRFIEQSRQWRSKHLQKIARFLIKCHFTPNIITFLSLIFGFLMVYFLFQNQIYFMVFALMHLIADGLDGVMARISHHSTFGKYFDHLSDQTITLLILIKIALYLQDYYVYIIITLFILAEINFLISRLQVPILFTRTFIIIILALNFPTIAYLTTGVASLYALGKQIEYYYKIGVN